ncbi:GspH/FimT family pseudopilin [Marinimicrobium locisalis]|uniref:GspH/FimT family pseudopilin n=1 Tax=Marinimicrobium locisalis TaxID=546022 RepID=UPI0032213D54
MRHLNRAGTAGFTLIELMVTLAVLAIILAVAVPSFTSQIRNNRSMALGEEFVTALSVARSEAVKRSGIVSVCASNAAQTDCANDWANGWLVFIDRDPDGETGDTPTIDDQADILRIREPLEGEMSLEVNRGAAVEHVRFNSMGALARTDNVPVTAVARHEECVGDAARAIRVSIAGSINSQSTGC